jgi:hypothetical protein
VLSNSLRACGSILDMVETVTNTVISAMLQDGTEHRGDIGFTAVEVAEAKRVLQACFHTFTKTIEDAKTRSLDEKAAL